MIKRYEYCPYLSIIASKNNERDIDYDLFNIAKISEFRPPQDSQI